MLNCLFIVGKISIQFPPPFPKTGFLRRRLLVRLERSAETAPKEV